MKILKICLTYSCPFKCYFCFNKDKANDTMLLDLNVLESFLKEHSQKFDKIIISGGEPTLIFKSYLRDVIDIVKKYTTIVEMETYPIIDSGLFNEFPEIFPKVSYDITARSKVQEVWKQLLKMPTEFDINVTLSPIVFRFSPNKILQTLNLLPKLRNVTFKPFFNNPNYQHNIKKEDYQKFVDVLNNSKLNLHFTYQYADFNDEFILNPYGKLLSVQFDNDIRYEKEITADEIDKHYTNYPNNVRL